GPARIPGSPPPNPTYILCPVEPVLRTVNQEEPTMDHFRFSFDNRRVIRRSRTVGRVGALDPILTAP
ncbi:hypothetical protein QEN42_05165, partial [Gordonia alkanivorans]|uniref:hypothetical protein n=1 Tax=Gordonia alkanivorans TaxID=84096 RepID=UPI00244A9EE5